jgi:hypothetical protein
MNTTLQRPQVLPGLVLLPVEDGVLLDGVGKLQVFRGPMAQTILPQLIEYADGTRSAEELIQAFPDVAPPDIHTSLELLASSGLLQAEPDAATHVPHQWQDTAAFFGRSRARFANSRAAHEIFQQLQSWQVRIIPAANCHSAAEQLSKLLHSSCVASAQVMTLDEVLATPASQLLVIAMAVTAEDERIFEKLEAASSPGFASSFIRNQIWPMWARCSNLETVVALHVFAGYTEENNRTALRTNRNSRSWTPL